MCLCVCVYVAVCVRAGVRTCVRLCMCWWICACLRACVFACMCLCIWCVSITSTFTCLASSTCARYVLVFRSCPVTTTNKHWLAWTVDRSGTANIEITCYGTSLRTTVISSRLQVRLLFSYESSTYCIGYTNDLVSTHSRSFGITTVMRHALTIYYMKIDYPSPCSCFLCEIVVKGW